MQISGTDVLVGVYPTLILPRIEMKKKNDAQANEQISNEKEIEKEFLMVG